MNIAMFANAYKPVIGGLENSIATFTDDLRAMNHNVLIVTLAFSGAEKSDEQIFRLPAVKKVAGTQFSMRVPAPAGLSERLDLFEPEVIHSHHPFMVGDTALRAARERRLPVLFTHHTMYERYAYLFSRNSQALERIAAAIPTEYANLCDMVVAPTGSIRDLIRSRGVSVPIEVVPTGVDVEMYSGGDGKSFRKRNRIPEDAFVLGYLGRVVEAKNMRFVVETAIGFLSQCRDARFLVVGEGDYMPELRRMIKSAGVDSRVVITGSLEGRPVADAYSAMDAFLFASKTETQGIVLIESFCAGVPVVGLDAQATRDIVEDGKSGILLDDNNAAGDFVEQIKRLKNDTEFRRQLARGAKKRALDFDRKDCASRLLEVYRHLQKKNVAADAPEPDLMSAMRQRFSAEWDLFKEKLSVMGSAINDQGDV